MGVRAIVGVVAFAGLASSAVAQPLSFRFETSEQAFTPMHSYVSGELGDHLMFMTGVTGFGMHVLSTPKGPAPIFARKVDYNQSIVLVDEAAGTSESASLAHLSAAVRDALLVTNASAYQSGDTLYVYGGYGPNMDETDVITKATVLEVDLAAVRDAIVGAMPVPESAFSLSSSEFARTSGAKIFPLGEDRFVLYGGANFIGDYPSHTLEGYTDAAQVFDLSVSATTPVQTLVSEDPFTTTDLHRRDLNGHSGAVATGGGSYDYGFLVTGGVFKFGFTYYDTPVTWLEGDAYAYEDVSVTSKLNLYAGPNAGFFAEASGQNRVVLFGGITAYDSLESPTGNFSLPWSDMISECVFDGMAWAEERMLGNTPAPIAEGELVKNKALPTLANGQIELDLLPPNEILLGSIYGGIHAAEATASPTTWASGEVIDVYMVKGVRGDLTGNGETDSADLATLLAAWGNGGYTPSDLNWDGAVNSADLAVLLSLWGRDYPG